MKSSTLLKLVAAFALLAATGCSASNNKNKSGAGEGDGDSGINSSCESEGATDCVDGNSVVCQDGDWVVSEECAGDKPACDPDLGCLQCEPNTLSCEDQSVIQCNEDGTGTSFIEQCEGDAECVNGECTSGADCAGAALSSSYLGCEFLAVSTGNLVLSSVFDEDFAIVVGNPEGSEPAEITVTRGASIVTTATVDPGDTAAISLPMVLELKGAEQSVIVPNGAYEVTSTVPVVAYQYNPLNFTTGSGGTELEDFSYTNDASLLLPEHSLTGNYMASTWPTWGHGTWMQMPALGVDGSWSMWYPGFVTVAGTVDGTEVTITSTAHTAKGNPAALAPGDSTTVTLNRGDVLQLFSQRPKAAKLLTFCEDEGWEQKNTGVCPPKNIIQECDAFCSVTDADLTGTTVSATAPVAVFSGHVCTFMPFYSWACDHLEEMMLPVETWGSQVVMTAPLLPEGDGVARTKYRILAREADTDVTITPGVIPPFTLGAGKFAEFETDIDFVARATKQIFVTQTLLGEDEIGSNGGDPAMGSGIPLFQSRGTYAFLTPDTYTSNYLNVVAPTGTTVTLDDVEITNWNPITSTEYSVARIPISPGAHQAKSEGNVGFGITSYGYASYTSYLYPGGLNLNDYPVR